MKGLRIVGVPTGLQTGHPPNKTSEWHSQSQYSRSPRPTFTCFARRCRIVDYLAVAYNYAKLCYKLSIVCGIAVTLRFWKLDHQWEVQ
jgi:hypothetical protein